MCLQAAPGKSSIGKHGSDPRPADAPDSPRSAGYLSRTARQDGPQPVWSTESTRQFVRATKPETASSMAAHEAVNIAARATSTMSHPGRARPRYGRIAWRKRRLARLRRTALPTPRPAATPQRDTARPLAHVIRITSGWAWAFPVRRTRWKSAEAVSRYLRFIHLVGWMGARPGTQPCAHPGALIASCLPVGLLHMRVGANCKAMATLQPPPLKHTTPRPGCHARPETMDTHAAPDLRLISSLRHRLFLNDLPGSSAPARPGDYTLCRYDGQRVTGGRRVLPQGCGPVSSCQDSQGLRAFDGIRFPFPLPEIRSAKRDDKLLRRQYVAAVSPG